MPEPMSETVTTCNLCGDDASLHEYHKAPSGAGAYAATWKDKPHRLIYDLIRGTRRLQSALTAAHAQVEESRVQLAEHQRHFAEESLLCRAAMQGKATAEKHIVTVCDQRDFAREEAAKVAGLTCERNEYRERSERLERQLAEAQRWESGFRNIVTTLVGPRVQFEIQDIVDSVEASLERLDWLSGHVINVRDPLPHGSRDLFWYSPPFDEEGEPNGAKSLGQIIDQARKVTGADRG